MAKAIGPGPLMALAAAALFGASTPMAKLLLGDGVDPWLLAGLLYFGSGVGLFLVQLGRSAVGIPTVEAPLRGSDIGTLALVVLSGGIVGPLLLMWGLAGTPASSAALLLNLEGLATMVIAWVWFREHVDRRLLVGAFAIVAGAGLLSWQPGGAALGLGAWAIAGACLAWGIDNNLTRKLSSADPVQIAMIKGQAAGTVNLGISLARGVDLPGAGTLVAGGAVGFLGYGISLVLFVLALRHLGTARTGAYFSTAPFLGAVVAIMLLDEQITTPLIAAALLMAAGVYLHLSERHEHEHVHEALDHEHRHFHDDHHQHQHGPGHPPGEPHTHRHRHDALVHRHAHNPDLHHRHRHGR